MQEPLLVDGIPCAEGDVIPPMPSSYISEFLVVDVCMINSTVWFPNLGSMTHSKVSGWLCDIMQNKQDCEKEQASRGYTNILRDKTRGEFGFTYYSIARDFKTSCDWCYCEPYIHISKRPAGTYTFAHIYIRMGGCIRGNTNLETLTDVQSQKWVVLDQAACRRWSARDEKIQAHHIIQGS